MPIEVLMPALSPTMTEGNLAKWLKKEGDQIKAGDVLAEIETDKATMEVEAVDEGILGKIVVKDGTENVPVNSLIALILEEGEDKKALDSYKLPEAPKKAESAQEKPAEVAPKAAPIAQTAPITPTFTAPKVTTTKNNQKVIASPLAKRIAEQNNVNISEVFGTGPNGRIIKSDVLDFAKGGSKSGLVRRNAQEYNLQKNSNIRKVIAQRLLASKQHVPHFYLNSEAQIDKLLELRQTINDNAPIVNDKPAYKISVNDLIIKACAMALKAVPAANSSWSDDAIILYNNVDISVAVAIEDGLITPIIRNADQKSIIDISNEMKELIHKAKSGKLQPEEFQGGGFSISNLGMYDITSFNAIVNPPQSCILAVGAGIKKPIVTSNDTIEIGHIMSMNLSCDHRSVDGAVGALFLKALKRVMQNPITMLL